jgi:hypothetical protein
LVGEADGVDCTELILEFEELLPSILSIPNFSSGLFEELSLDSSFIDSS